MGEWRLSPLCPRVHSTQRPALSLIGFDSRQAPSAPFGPLMTEACLSLRPQFCLSDNGSRCSSNMFRRYRPLLGYPGRHKSVVVLAVLVLLVLVRSLPSLKDRLDGRVEGPHVEDRPRYLYHSAFRKDPDIAYESRLRDALRDIEKQSALHDNSGAPNTLWQILLGQGPVAEQRGDDSLRFEEENSEWSYKVSITGATLTWVRSPWPLGAVVDLANSSL